MCPIRSCLAYLDRPPCEAVIPEGLVEPGDDTSILSTIIGKAKRLEDQGCECISWGGRVDKIEITEVDLRLGEENKVEEWGLKIFEAGEGRTTVFTNGSKSEEGVVTAGWYLRKIVNTDTLGPSVTVWDGEVTAIRGGLNATKNQKVLILTDSQAAIKAIREGRKDRKR